LGLPLVVAGGIEGELSDELAALVEHTDVQVVHEYQDPAPAVAAPETDVVELAVVAQRDHATGVNAIMAQAVVPLGDRLTRRHGFRARRECLSGGAPVQGAVGPAGVVVAREHVELGLQRP